MNNSNEPHLLFKILFTGSSGVGKSSILERATNQNFSGVLLSTIGVDFKIKTYEIDGKPVKLQMWDTAGQERFRTISQAYYRGAQGVVLVYDVTNDESFQALPNWILEIQKNAGSDVEIVLLANKSDLIDQRVVGYDAGKQLADDFGMKYFETSAKMAWNVDDALKTLTKALKDKRENRPRENIIKEEIKVVHEEKKRPCCSL